MVFVLVFVSHKTIECVPHTNNGYRIRLYVTQAIVKKPEEYGILLFSWPECCIRKDNCSQTTIVPWKEAGITVVVSLFKSRLIASHKVMETRRMLHVNAKSYVKKVQLSVRFRSHHETYIGHVFLIRTTLGWKGYEPAWRCIAHLKNHTFLCFVWFVIRHLYP